MYFKQFYLACLAHASYLIGSEGEAVVVDPQRDVDQYLKEAAANDLKIKYVIETHLHADFVSGHRELASRTGAVARHGSGCGAGVWPKLGDQRCGGCRRVAGGTARTELARTQCGEPETTFRRRVGRSPREFQQRYGDGPELCRPESL